MEIAMRNVPRTFVSSVLNSARASLKARISVGQTKVKSLVGVRFGIGMTDGLEVRT